nr:MAG TPA: hypothetical protein [Microviridae sp.]
MLRKLRILVLQYLSFRYTSKGTTAPLSEPLTLAGRRRPKARLYLRYVK